MYAAAKRKKDNRPQESLIFLIPLGELVPRKVGWPLDSEGVGGTR
jgi:hypothetical protein